MMSTTVLSSTMKNAPKIDEEDRRHIELADRLGRVLPHALEVEDRLREDRAAADHRAEVEPQSVMTGINELRSTW